MASASRGRGGRARRQESPEVKLSKALSYICRHGASKEGLVLQEEGDVKHVVEVNDKKRFAVRNDPVNGRLMIRANQGHTLEVDGLDLQPIKGSAEAPVVVHGTYLEAWQFIQKQMVTRSLDPPTMSSSAQEIEKDFFHQNTSTELYNLDHVNSYKSVDVIMPII